MKNFVFAAIIFSLSFHVFSSSASGDQLTARSVVEAIDRVTLSSEINDKIQSVPFRDGEAFRKGDALVRFNCALLRAEKEKAQAALAEITASVENNVRLEKLNSVSKATVAIDLARQQQRAAELRIAELSEARCTIRAPWNGRVVLRYVEPHQSVSANQKLIEIVNPSGLEVKAIVPSVWLAWLSSEAEVSIAIDESAETFKGVVKLIGASIDPVSRTVAVHIALEEERSTLVPGMGALVTFRRP